MRRRRMAPAFKKQRKKPAIPQRMVPNLDECQQVRRNLWKDENEVYWTIYKDENFPEGLILRCFPSGNPKDQQGQRWVCHYGSVFPRPNLTDEEMKAAEEALETKMRANKRFGRHYGKILKRYV